MSCPICGKSLEKIRVTAFISKLSFEVWTRTKDGTYRFDSVKDWKRVDDEIQEVRCPNCGYELRFRLRDQKIEILSMEAGP